MSSSSSSSPRLWEIDAMRGIAIILMVIYHGVFSLDYFFGQAIDSQHGFWYWEGRVSAVIFMVLVGVASALIRQRYEGAAYFNKQLRRGLELVGWGLVITVITFIALPQEAIWFGILHFLGFCVLLTSPLASYKWLNLFLAAVAWGVGFWLESLHWNTVFGVFVGAPPVGYQSLDYYPLFPRMAWILLGITLGNWAYTKKEPWIQEGPGILGGALTWLGQKSLVIYLVHQPIVVGLLWLIFRTNDQ